jgi:hypothetical protein
MITRRTALGIGITFASAAFASSFEAYAAPPSIHPQPIDALLVDKSVPLPRQIAAYIDARRHMLPVVAIDLDATGYNDLMELLNKSGVIAGISSGAALFCLERLAWNHGFRLTGRSPQCLSTLNAQICQQDIAAFLLAAHSPDAPHSSETCLYRPSHTDDTLHAWVMRKIASGHYRQTSGVV